MKKRLLALNLALALLLTLMPPVALADGPVVLVPDENGNVYAEYYVNEGSDLTTELKFTPSQTGIYRLQIWQPQVQPVTEESLMLYRTGENAEVISFSLNENADATRCVLEAGTAYTFSVQNNCAGQHLLSISFIEAAEYVEPIAIDSEIFPDDTSRWYATWYDINNNRMLEADELACVNDLWIRVGPDSVGDESDFSVYWFDSISWLDRFVYTKGIHLSCAGWQYEYAENVENVTKIPALPKNVEYLCVNFFNGLASWPDLSEYTNLTELDCRYNKLTELPNLPENLRYLDCSENKLTSLPALPGGLQKLDCSGNQIIEWPKLPENLYKLECCGCQLTSLPTLPDGLLFLDYGYNQITELPKLPDGLNYLGCSGNQLTSLPTLPDGLAGLHCNDNQLTLMPNLPNSLLDLSCFDNQLTLLPDLPDSLECLYCSNNQLTSLPDLPSSMGALDCSNNNLTSIRLNPDADYWWIDVSNNCLPGKEAVTGQDIVWDEVNEWGEVDFTFGTQRTAEIHTHTTETVNYIAPTCTEDGYTGDEVCTVCGETVSTGEVIPATGHSYGDDNICDDCGHKQSVTETIQTWINDTIQSIRNFFDKIFGRF